MELSVPLRRASTDETEWLASKVPCQPSSRNVPEELGELLKTARFGPATSLIADTVVVSPRPSLNFIPMLGEVPFVPKTAKSPLPGPPWPAAGLQLLACRHASPAPLEPPVQVNSAAGAAHVSDKAHKVPMQFRKRGFRTRPRCEEQPIRSIG